MGINRLSSLAIGNLPGIAKGRRMTDYLDELDTYLRSDDSPEDCMMLSDLDGFLTGIACTPHPVPNWAVTAFGTDEAVPERIMLLIERRLQEIEDGLKAQPPKLEPAFWQAPEGHSVAMDWCEGFMDAVKLDATPWDALNETSTGAKFMLPILVHMCNRRSNTRPR
jgi:uncharacterized protein